MMFKLSDPAETTYLWIVYKFQGSKRHKEFVEIFSPR